MTLPCPLVGTWVQPIRRTLDDYSRYILAWILRPTMQTNDLIATLELVRAGAEGRGGSTRTRHPISRTALLDHRGALR